jgi:integrase/recombinase XerD
MKRRDVKNHRDLLGPILQRYFCSYLIGQRNLSPRTVSSYRDCFKLLIRFLEQHRDIEAETLHVTDLDAPNILAFLENLERRRGNSARSRNARLAAIRAFVRYAASVDPPSLAIAQRVCAIPTKRYERKAVSSLTCRQTQALLEAPNASTRIGLRDRVLLMLMYNTGARVSEIAALHVGDLRLADGGYVQIQGKGRKQRSVPLWRRTVNLLKRWLKHTDMSPQAPLLPNARGGFMTRAGIAQRLERAVKTAAKTNASLLDCGISPHTIRHTTAMHMLQSRVGLPMIAMWLGHESIQTTHQYLAADLQTKKQALATLKAPRLSTPRRVVAKPLMRFLEDL